MNEPIALNAIHQAAAAGNVDQIKAYIAKDPALVSQRHSEDQTTPLVHAIQHGRLEAVAALLEANAPLDYIDKSTNRMLVHFIPRSGHDRKKIRQLLVKAMEEKFRELYWKLTHPLHEKKHTLIVLLLNLIVHYQLKRNYHIMRETLKKLDCEFYSFVSNKGPLSEKDLANIYSFAGNICGSVNAIKDALKYWQIAIRNYARAIKASFDSDENLKIINMIVNNYEKIIEAIKDDKNPVSLLPVLEDEISTHIRLQNMLKDPNTTSSALLNNSSELKNILFQFSQLIKSLREQAREAKKIVPSNLVGTRAEIQLLLEFARKQRQEIEKRRPSSASSKPISLYWKAEPAAMKLKPFATVVLPSALKSKKVDELTEEDQQRPAKRVKFAPPLSNSLGRR